MEIQGIYVIRHVLTERVYVGSAVNISGRWNNHRHRLRKGNHHAKRLQAAWSLSGEDAFDFRVVEIVPLKRAMIEREQWWMDELQAADLKIGFNTCRSAGHTAGRVTPPETRLKISAGNTGKIHPPEFGAAITARSMGHEVKPETRAKLSAALIGKLASWNRGLVRSPETRAKVRAARLGSVASAETKAKMSAIRAGRPAPWFAGKIASLETRQKMSASRTGKRASPETRAKMRKHHLFVD